MNYITTTQLRTQTSAFVDTLLAGQSIDLIHRSKNLGSLTLQPIPTQKTDHRRLAKNIQALKLHYLTVAQMKKNYQAYMTKKYGPGVS